MESPTAAPRPCPICKGPVGLADTNSSSIFRPFPVWEEPKARPSFSTFCTLSCQNAGEKVTFRKPGPAISVVISPCIRAESSAASFSASWRGGIPACFVSTMARLVARSPCFAFHDRLGRPFPAEISNDGTKIVLQKKNVAHGSSVPFRAV